MRASLTPQKTRIPRVKNQMASQTGGRALEAARNAASWLLEKDRPSKRLLMAGTDCIACIAAVWLSFSLRLGFWEFNTAPVRAFAVFQLVTFLIIFNFVGAYRNIFRFHGARGLIPPISPLRC